MSKMIEARPVITASVVRNIRAALADGHTIVEISKYTGIPRTSLWRIKHRKTWGWLA